MSEGKDRIFKEEKVIHPASGFGMLFLTIILLIASVAGMIVGGVCISDGSEIFGGILLAVSIIVVCVAPVLFAGLKVIHPNEALVLTLFGKYYGTIEENGFYFVNPFCTAVNPTASAAVNIAMAASGKSSGTTASFNKKVSLKAMTLNNEQQKVNDEMGNPIIIGAIVIWKVESATKAVFNVQNYKSYLSIQCDSIIRNVARRYPYDVNEGSDEKSLRGSSQEVADIMKNELQEKVEDAGLKVMEVKITHLSYAPEIAAAMLQRQQAAAIIDARQKIVEGAVGMVEMALTKLNENDIVDLDEERKAAMVSNLLVVLCGNKDAQPIVNSGTLY